MARRLQAPVVVGADRYQAGLLAEKTFPSQVHLLDDGFQHRRLHRDCDLVMLPQADLDDTLLPVGRLREPQASLNRADVLVVHRWSRICRRAWRPTDLERDREQLELRPTHGRAIAFCGIAKAISSLFSLKLSSGAGGYSRFSRSPSLLCWRTFSSCWKKAAE